MFDRLLNRLPRYRGHETAIIKGKQSADDIIKEVLKAHTAFAFHYDSISNEFNEPGTLEKLFAFCQDELRYKEEPGAYQTTRSPAAILHLGKNKTFGVDCKHFANFIAGVLDAKNRSGQGYYNFRYRFMNTRDADPNHVYVIVKTLDGEVWIDPTPIKDRSRGYIQREFNDRFLTPVTSEDKKPSTMIARLSGASTGTAYRVISEDTCNSMGQSFFGEDDEDDEDGESALQATQDSISSLVSWLPDGGLKNFLTGFLKDPISALVSLIKGRTYTSGEYALGEIYMRNILGMAEIQSRQAVPDAYAVQARRFFSVAMGVHIGSGDHLNELVKSVDAYYAWMPANVDAATSRPQLERAHQVLKMLNYGPAVRDLRWPLAKFSELPYIYPVPDISPGSLFSGTHPILNIDFKDGYPLQTTYPVPQGPGTGEPAPTDPPPPPGPPGPGPTEAGISAGKVLLFAGLGAGALFIANRPKPKKVTGAKTGVNPLFVGLGIAAVAGIGYYFIKKQSVDEKRKYLAALSPDETVWVALVLETMTDEEIQVFYDASVYYSEANPVPPGPLRDKLTVICNKYNICT